MEKLCWIKNVLSRAFSSMFLLILQQGTQGKNSLSILISLLIFSFRKKNIQNSRRNSFLTCTLPLLSGVGDIGGEEISTDFFFNLSSQFFLQHFN